MASRRIVQVFQEIVRPRDFTFRGIFQPERLRRRLRLAAGVIRAAATGKVTPQVRKDLVDEISDAILDSPFLRHFQDIERERLEGLVLDPESARRRADEIEKAAREAAKDVEKAAEAELRKARRRAGL